MDKTGRYISNYRCPTYAPTTIRVYTEENVILATFNLYLSLIFDQISPERQEKMENYHWLLERILQTTKVILEVVESCDKY